MRQAGILPRVAIRKPHGTGRAERLDPQQKRVKGQIMADSYAWLLGELEAFAETGVYHMIDKKKVKCFYRLFAWPADKVRCGDNVGRGALKALHFL